MKKSSPAPTSISCGETEKEILLYMQRHGNVLRNQTKAADKRRGGIGVARTTFRSALKRLAEKGLVKHVHMGSYEITKKGKKVLSILNSGDDGSPVGWQDRGGEITQMQHNLKLHRSEFKMPIADQSLFTENKLDRLGNWKPVPMNGWHYYIVEHDGNTLRINPHVVIIEIKQIIEEDAEHALFNLVLEAKKYVEILKEIGIVGEGFYFDGAEYSRIESYLAQFLAKRFDRYELTLKDGSRFFIDFSDNRVEDETDHIRTRENLDYNMEQLLEGRYDFDDLRLVKQVAMENTKGLLILAKTVNELLAKAQPPVPEPLTKRPDYFG